ncbi:MAG: YbjQ family protein [Candidatus Omnitrophica bacterium]|nr:YbjQ family protein [Candidatus Omnitrophota bacterium]MCA9415395.1 YbjQ family protein [Candidatus Omnitrophota bacterium]MCB9769841.1 YbjQ family protein [Candidatus Omnitrophota bacterium]
MTPELVPILVYVVPFLFLMSLGIFVGKTTEIRHLRDLHRREMETAHMAVSDLKTFPGLVGNEPQGILVSGEVVIATDYLKSFLAGLRKIVGGRVGSYETLVMRARREAILRMKQEALALGFNAVCNIRLDTADIGGNTTNRKIAMVAVLASGTAYRIGANHPPNKF